MKDLLKTHRLCSGWIDELIRACAPIQPEAVEKALRDDLHAAFQDPSIQIVVCGEWNAGKSTLINALVGAPDLLPVDVRPCTSYVTLVQGGDTPRFEVCRDAKCQAISRDEFLGYVARDEEDPGIEFLRASGPYPWFEGPIVLVDTPGLEDLSRTRANITLNYLPRADVILLVLEATSGVKGTDRRFVREHLTPRELGRTIVVFNKVDRLNRREDVDRRLRYCRDILDVELPDAPWVPTSASSAFEEDGQGPCSESGIPALRAEIAKIARRERARLIAARFVRPARQRLNELEARTLAEEATLELPLREAKARVAKFRKDAAQATKRNAKLFQTARNGILAEVGQWLSRLPVELQAFTGRILQDVDALDHGEALRAYVQTEVLDREIGRELRKLCAEFERELTLAVDRAGNGILGQELVLPMSLSVEGVPRLAPITTVFQELPEPAARFLKAMLLDLRSFGDVLVPVLERIRLGHLLRGASLLGSLLGRAIVKPRLRNGVAKTLDGLPDRVEAALRQRASALTDAALEEVRSELDAQVHAIETGLEEARALLARDSAAAEARRTVLAHLRQSIGVFREQLLSIAVEAGFQGVSDSG